MAKPTYLQLEESIEACMLRDRFRMRNDIKKKRKRELLEAAIERSSRTAATRKASLPSIQFPEQLPITAHVDEIRTALLGHQVIIVAGETGSGKTTQLPKICLSAGRGIFGTIGHTQPRRVAARTISHRLAEELRVSLGDIVGYQVRFQDLSKPTTLIKVMTDGVLLAETQNDQFLERYDTLIIDEAHERSLNIDFLLGYIKRILPKRPELKVIVTSATIDVKRFSEHFGNAPIIEVSGRTFPVTVHYRPVLEMAKVDDSDDVQIKSIIEVLAEIDNKKNGDVLIFLPGEREIRETAREIKKSGPKGYEVLPLYSRLSIAEQNRVFAAHTNRRIVLSTNVAETSLTVPGIRYVIDTGTARISRYSFRSKVQQLPTEPVSQASANQRMGRCGRISEGECYRLYSLEDFGARPAFTEPEILRTNLASVILRMLQLRLGEVGRFPFLEKPSPKQINDGFGLLFELGAVERNNQITRLGKQLSRFPIDLRYARMLLAAANTGSLRELLIITSALTIQDPRERPFDHQQASDEVHKKHRDERSDFLALVNLWDEYEQQRQDLAQGQLRKYCRKEFLSFNRMQEWREIHRQLLLLSKELGLKQNVNPADYAQVHRAIMPGLLGHISEKVTENEYRGARNRKQFIFPGSSQFSRRPRWIMSAEIVETSRLFARTVADIDSRWIEPIAGHLLTRTYHDPVFDPDRGQTVAKEEVSLYGIVIVSNRPVDFGSVDAVSARELFIEKALVQGELKTAIKFFKANRSLVHDIEQLESKARKRDILVESRAVFDFYDSLLPAGVSSELDLISFLDQQQGADAQLRLSRKELMRREAEISETLYPDELKVASSDLKLHYQFDPGREDDGISVDVPLVLLNQVSKAQLDWLIPGLLKEKCLALIRSLPKALRKHFVPAPEYVERVLADFQFDGRELTTALADRLFRLSGAKVDESDFREDQLDRHLTINIRVIDDKGKVLQKGRDLVSLVQALGEDVSARFNKRQVHPLERQGMVDWDFGDLPELIEVSEGGISVRAHTALIDCGDSVAIELMESAWQAKLKTEKGLCRLYLLKLKDQRKFLEQNIPEFDKFSLYYATRGTRVELVKNIVEAVFIYTFIESEPLIYKSAEFEERLKRKSELYSKLGLVAKLLGLSLQLALAIEGQLRSLEGESNDTVADMRRQLDYLFPAQFPVGIPFQWLRHYPRYLKAMAYRLDRLGSNRHKDQLGIAQITPWIEKFEATEDENKSRLVAYRWMIEEFRVSLFAQAIGTNMAVSEKRLAKEWVSVMGMRE